MMQYIIETTYNQTNDYITELQKQNRELQRENRKLKDGVITFNEMLGMMKDKVKDLS